MSKKQATQETDQATADQATADQATADQATADQATADQATADQAAADQAAAEQVEAVLLRDSDLGSVGDVISIDKANVGVYTLHGMIDAHPAAVDYAKSQKKK